MWDQIAASIEFVDGDEMVLTDKNKVFVVVFWDDERGVRAFRTEIATEVQIKNGRKEYDI